MKRRGRSYIWATGGEKKQGKVIVKQFNEGENFLES
jgi:hypothetical protein